MNNFFIHKYLIDLNFGFMIAVTEKRKALICPLDWGIGHATRCIPVIRKLEKAGFSVIVAAAGRPLEFLKKECTGIDFIDFPGTRVSYPQSNRMALKMFRMAPLFLTGIAREHKALMKLASELAPDLIVSDNRYGCWHPFIPSVFITHQLDIQVPVYMKFLQPLICRLNFHFIRKYRECWVPDFEPHRGLAGDLSHPPELPHNAYYIGSLSRFSEFTDTAMQERPPVLDLLVLLSGPEPQRTILEKKIFRQVSNINMRVVIVQGITEKEEVKGINENITVFSHLETEKLHQLILRAGMIISRPGYSSIMDLVTVGKRAIFIPTPGQTEQEYLARYLMDKKIFFSIDQDRFDLLYALEMARNFPGMIIRNDYRALEERIRHVTRIE